MRSPRALRTRIRRFEIEVEDFEVEFDTEDYSPQIQQDSITVSVAELVGFVTDLICGIRELSLNLMDLPYFEEPDCSTSLFYLFKDGPCNVPEILSGSAWMNLSRLHWCSSDLPAVIASLPNLEHLSVNINCSLPRKVDINCAPAIASLEIALDSLKLLPDSDELAADIDKDRFYDFLGVCIFLEELRVTHCDYVETSSLFHAQYMGSCQELAARLQEELPALRKLYIELHPETNKAFDGSDSANS